MFEELEKIKSECLNCQRCPLGKTRTKVVFSAGIPNNKIVLIGEAPGQNLSDFPEIKISIFATQLNAVRRKIVILYQKKNWHAEIIWIGS